MLLAETRWESIITGELKGFAETLCVCLIGCDFFSIATWLDQENDVLYATGLHFE